MLLQVLITIGASQAFTLAALIMLKKKRTDGDYLLGTVLFLMFSITLLYNYHEELKEVGFINFPINSFTLAYLAFPLFFLYIKAATQGEINLSKWTNFIHFVPFILANIWIAWFFYPLSVAEKIECYQSIHCGSSPLWFNIFYYTLFFGVMPAYLIKGFRLLQRYEKNILTKFSYTENVSLSWLNRFFWAMIIVFFGFLLFEVLGNRLLSLIGDSGFKISFLLLIANIFYVGYYGLRHQTIFFDLQEFVFEEVGTPAPEDPNNKYQYSSLTSNKADVYLNDLRQFMVKEKPFLEPKITISELAQRTDIPVSYLSQIINERLEQNFFDFINSYRVEEFKNLLQQPENHNFTLLSLAYEAGFNSKSTFNAIFKKFTGSTPSEFARQLKLQELKG